MEKVIIILVTLIYPAAHFPNSTEPTWQLQPNLSISASCQAYVDRKSNVYINDIELTIALVFAQLMPLRKCSDTVTTAPTKMKVLIVLSILIIGYLSM